MDGKVGMTTEDRGKQRTIDMANITQFSWDQDRCAPIEGIVQSLQQQ